MTEKEQEELLDDLRLEFDERNRMSEMVEQPSWEAIKEELEGRFKIELYGRTINSFNILTQWTPIFIEIRWGKDVPKGKEGYLLSIAPRDTAKHHFYCTPMLEKDSLEKVIREMSMYCKKAEPKQVSLF